MSKISSYKATNNKLAKNIVHFGIFNNANSLSLERSAGSSEAKLKYYHGTELLSTVSLIDYQADEIIQIFTRLSFNPQSGEWSEKFELKLPEVTVSCRLRKSFQVSTEIIYLQFVLPKDKFDSWDQLGFANDFGDEILDHLELRSGLVALVSSGVDRNTDLAYALLAEMNHAGLSIACLESPVSYKITEYNQLDWSYGLGYSYQEAYDQVCQYHNDIYYFDYFNKLDPYALTRLTSSSLVIVGLTSIGLLEAVKELMLRDKYLIERLRMIIVQKELPRNCQCCAEPVTLTEEEVRSLMQITGLEYQFITTQQFFSSRGCHECSFTGYAGNQIVYDILLLDAELQKSLVDNGLTQITVEKITASQVLNSLESAWIKAVDGAINPRTIISSFA